MIVFITIYYDAQRFIFAFFSVQNVQTLSKISSKLDSLVLYNVHTTIQFVIIKNIVQ